MGIFLILYASLAAPKLPRSIAIYFDNTWFKLVFMFFIGYLTTKDVSVAIIAAVALLVTLQTLSSQKVADAVVAKVEGFGNVKKRKVRFIEKFSEAVAEGASQEEAKVVAEQAVIADVIAEGATQEEAQAVAEAVAQEVVAPVSEASAVPMPPSVAPVMPEVVAPEMMPEAVVPAMEEVVGVSEQLPGAMLSEVVTEIKPEEPRAEVQEETLMSACGGPSEAVNGYEGSELAQF